jgi:hypothetical protein
MRFPLVSLDFYENFYENFISGMSEIAIEKGRFLVGCNMFQVEVYYSTTYHSKASRGIPLVDKMTANLAATSQS